MLKEILILFVPGAIGVILYRYLEKTKWSVWTYLENYSLLLVLTYFMARTTFYISGLQEFSIRETDFIVQMKFGILSIILSVALACAFHYGKAIYHKNQRYGKEY